MYDRDLKNMIDSARREGKEKVAINLKVMRLPIVDIVKATGLSEEEILKL